MTTEVPHTWTRLVQTHQTHQQRQWYLCMCNSIRNRSWSFIDLKFAKSMIYLSLSLALLLCSYCHIHGASVTRHPKKSKTVKSRLMKTQTEASRRQFVAWRPEEPHSSSPTSSFTLLSIVVSANSSFLYPPTCGSPHHCMWYLNLFDSIWVGFSQHQLPPSGLWCTVLEDQNAREPELQKILDSCPTS